MPEKAEVIVDKMIELFCECSEGFADDDDDALKLQVKFEDGFRELICEYRGHRIVPDHCGLPEHFYCIVCNRRESDIKAETTNV